MSFVRAKNRIKEMFREGKIPLGSCVYSFSPSIVELCGCCKLDWLRIDNEHAWRQDDSLEHMIRAADCANLPVIVRVDEGNTSLIQKALELGASGVLVPHITTEDDALRVVRAAKFPPRGERGSSNLCRSARWMTEKPLTYRDYANDETLVAVMIEDHKAISNVDKILAVDGIDVAFFGPSDFSASIGAFGEGLKNAKVMEALKTAIVATHKHGKHICVGASYPWVEQAKKLTDLGVDMIEIGHDISILARMYQDLVPEIRKITTST